MKYSRQSLLALLKQEKITSTKDFRARFPAAYLWYLRHKQEVGELPLSKHKRHELTKAECVEVASRFQHRSDLQTHDKGVYLKALRNGWLDEICAHMVPKPFVAKGGTPGQPSPDRIDLEGHIFGKWTVLRREGVGKGKGWVCRCECGTEAVVSGSNLRQGLSTKCSRCSNQVSRPMREIYECLLGHGINAELSAKPFGFEIDIYVPEKKFFLEYDGLLWHSSKFRASAAAEKERYERFKAHGLSGMRVFEDQYKDKKGLIMAMVLHRLGVRGTTTPISPKLEICTYPAKHRQFCNTYHLDGYGRSSWAVVATNSNGDVLAFMGFRPYLSGQYKGQPELSRFCTNYNYNCYGLFGKMLKLATQYIKANKMGQVIVSASDNHISDGKVYANNGFKLLKTSESWFYYLHSQAKRLHRTAGKRLNPPKITPEQFALYPTEKAQTESGFTAEVLFGKREPMYRIWGWGHKLWVRHLKP